MEKILPLHIGQRLTDLKRSGLSLGLRINWNVILLGEGIQRVVRNHPEEFTKWTRIDRRFFLGALGVLGGWVFNPMKTSTRKLAPIGHRPCLVSS